MVIGIILAVPLTIIAVCMLTNKTFRINITHNYNTQQGAEQPLQQLTEEDLKEQQKEVTKGLVESLNDFLEGRDTIG
jgi:hypothetical protein